ncbi:MAG: hypothetical protein ABIR70_16435 [Bryobacteraceae bacterium]
MSKSLEPLLPFEPYEGISWSRAFFHTLCALPLTMTLTMIGFLRGKRGVLLLPPNRQGITFWMVASVLFAVWITYGVWKRRLVDWEKLYFSAETELKVPPTAQERYFLPCENSSGLVAFIGALLIGPSGLRFVGRKEGNLPGASAFQELVTIGPLNEIEISIEPTDWWRTSGFRSANQRVKIAWPNNSATFWMPSPEIAIGELKRVLQEPLSITPAPAKRQAVE